MNNKFLYILASLSIVYIFSCTDNPTIAGAGSETTNSLTGMVALADGKPAVNAIVRLYPVSYNPVKDAPLPSAMTAVTNCIGKYAFQEIDTGVYSIYVQYLQESKGTLIQNVKSLTDTVTVDNATVTAIGAVSVGFPDSADSSSGYVYIPGTPFFAYLNNGKKPVVLGSIPPCVIPRVMYASTKSSLTSVIISSVTVRPSDTTVVAHYAWSSSQRIYLNTTESGASITNTVHNFPVLIRLNKSNFDFNKAKADGSDLRFSTADNHFLSYEIERWDTTSGLADIWVRVDSILGNNSRQYILMYWGNPSAVNMSNGTATFDTAAGFQGVWHLSGQGNTLAYDATANGYHGTALNMATASTTEGVIGGSRSFNGTSSYITMQNTSAGKLNFAENGNYSMSLWVYAEAIDSSYHAIAGKGHEQYYMQFKCFKNGKATWEFVEFKNAKGWEYTEDSTPPAPGTKQWLYLTGVRSGESQKFYINGVKVIDTIFLMKGDYERNTSDNFCIGSFGRSVTIPYSQGWSFFKGKIDEVRVSSVAYNDDWVKLCYLNQKDDSKFIVFEK
jgi:hypothetical protein